MSKKRRLELLEAIQEQRNSHVMSLVLSDRANAMGRITSDVVREMYALLCAFKPVGKEKSLDLFLCGCGGDHDVPWRIAAMIREIFKNFHVLIPYKAHGAATMLALGADTIVMGEKGELSPISIVVGEKDLGEETGSDEAPPVCVEDVTALMAFVESLGRVREKQRIDAFLRTLDKVPPLLLGNVSKRLEQTKTTCMKLLESRGRWFKRGANTKIVKRLFSESLSPRRSISRTEAVKGFGLKQVRRDEGLEPALWELLTLYEEEFKTAEPFYPEEILEQSEDEEKVFSDLKLVYIETTKKTRVFQQDVKMKKLRQTPPQFQFNPQITLPSLPIPSGFSVNEESVFGYVQQWLHGHLPGIIDECFARWSHGLPVRAYERMEMNRRWVDE